MNAKKLHIPTEKIVPGITQTRSPRPGSYFQGIGIPGQVNRFDSGYTFQMNYRQKFWWGFTWSIRQLMRTRIKIYVKDEE